MSELGLSQDRHTQNGESSNGYDRGGLEDGGNTRRCVRNTHHAAYSIYTDKGRGFVKSQNGNMHVRGGVGEALSHPT